MKINQGFDATQLLAVTIGEVSATSQGVGGEIIHKYQAPYPSTHGFISKGSNQEIELVLRLNFTGDDARRIIESLGL